MSDEDLEFPLESVTLDSYEDGEIKNPTVFQDKSSFPLQIEAQPQKVTESDLDIFELKEVEKKILISEFSDCDMYLKNIHKGFSQASSTNSLIKLVIAGIGVHKHRRAVMKQMKEDIKNKGPTFELDEHGKLKT